MITCEAMSKRMPAVAAGRSEWSAQEAGHLRTCADCASEWRIVQAGAVLGQGIMPPESGVLAANLLERLREEKAQDRRRRFVRSGGLAGLAVAASIMAIVLVRPGAVQPPAPARTVAVLDLPLAELDGAEEADLEEALVEFDVPLADPAAVPDFDGLDATEVERALSAWEES